MYLAGLRSIPDELREAVQVDGAIDVQLYRDIILPILRPITLSALIVLDHISLKNLRPGLHHDRQRSWIRHRCARYLYV